MIKVFLKHHIYDVCINTFFEAIKKNFNIGGSLRRELVKEFAHCAEEFNELAYIMESQIEQLHDSSKLIASQLGRYSTDPNHIAKTWTDETTEFIKNRVSGVKIEIEDLRGRLKFGDQR